MFPQVKKKIYRHDVILAAKDREKIRMGAMRIMENRRRSKRRRIRFGREASTEQDIESMGSMEIIPARTPQEISRESIQTLRCPMAHERGTSQDERRIDAS